MRIIISNVRVSLHVSPTQFVLVLLLSLASAACSIRGMDFVWCAPGNVTSLTKKKSGTKELTQTKAGDVERRMTTKLARQNSRALTIFVSTFFRFEFLARSSSPVTHVPSFYLHFATAISWKIIQHRAAQANCI